MKKSYRFVFLMLVITLLTMMITLPASNSAQASTSEQSVEDRIIATLEEAAAALGGGFEWSFEENNYLYMERITQNIGYSQYSEAPIYLLEQIAIIPEDLTCQRGTPDHDPWTFHGMNGCSFTFYNIVSQVYWQPEDVLEIDGHKILLFAASWPRTSCPGNVGAECTANDKINHDSAIPLAEALHQAAINNGLYEPMPEETLPLDPGEGMPEDYDIPADTADSLETNAPAELPWPVILGSLGIPVVGAIAGTVLATILSGISAAGTSSVATSTATVSDTEASDPFAEPAEPKIGDESQQGMVWSPRPWDEAGPGYESKEVYEQTIDHLSRGDEWTTQGWKTRDQIRQNEQWEQNDREAVAREEAEWRAEMEEERKAPQEKETEPTKEDSDLQANEKQLVQSKIAQAAFDSDLQAINVKLTDEKKYVLNPYQGDPTVIGHRVITGINMVLNKTAGRITGQQGLTCEGYLDATEGQVVETLQKHFPGAKLQQVVFEEQSTNKASESWGNWFDSFVDDNHTLHKVTLPDGSEWAVDFHQYNAGNAKLLRPWSEAVQDWNDKYMKEEFHQRVRRTIMIKPLASE